MEHTNRNAMEILMNQYSDYDANRWHYDREYKMLVEMERKTIQVMANNNKDLYIMLDNINTIMWESFMDKNVDFGRNEGLKIMNVLEQWASKY